MLCACAPSTSFWTAWQNSRLQKDMYVEKQGVPAGGAAGTGGRYVMDVDVDVDVAPPGWGRVAGDFRACACFIATASSSATTSRVPVLEMMRSMLVLLASGELGMHGYERG
jgi:hypothetical protein